MGIFCLMNQVDASITVKSPDGKIKVEINTDANSNLNYSITANGKVVIEPSRIGIISDNIDLGNGIKFGTSQSSIIKETLSVFGVHSMALNYCKVSTIEIISPKEIWFLDVRVYNDGAGIRCRLSPKKERHIQGEASEWMVPSNTIYWYQKDLESYEGTFSKVLADTLKAGEVIGLPVTAILPTGNYIMITEANLVDYSDLAVKSSDKRTLKGLFHAEENGWKTDSEVVQPWRVTLIAKDLNALVNSDLLRNLCPNPAPELINADWIKPGRAGWNWWSTPTLVYNQQHQWVDWTKELGFEYYMIDAGWTRWQDGTKDAWACLSEVTSYAKSVGVNIWIWVHSREVTDPSERKRIFESAVKAGVKGIKIDFVPKCTRERSNWYEATLIDAAKNKLMIDFHGAVKPTGRDRTWPNELTREAIRGHEYHIKRYKRVLLPDHDCILPFNRLVQGFGDYTPTVFNPDELLGYTWPREIAQAIVFTSPFLCYADHPENYLKNPARDILKSIPSVYDETIVLKESEIGKCAAFARRNGDTWYIGIINGNDKNIVDIPLDFLPKGAFKLESYEDDETRDDGVIKNVTNVTNSSHIKLTIRKAGGYAAKITSL